MRLVEKHPRSTPVEPGEGRLDALRTYLLQEVEDSLSARNPQEAIWRENMRLYEGVPKNPVRNVPVENAPNLEVTLGAIACDAVYAQMIDLIFSINPVLTARGVNGRVAMDTAKALQRFINWGAGSEWALRNAVEHTALDDVQLGTGLYYIPFTEHKKKTKVSRTTSRAPRVVSIPPEDFLVPGGATDDLQTLRWIGYRQWLTLQEAKDKAAAKGWNITGEIDDTGQETGGIIPVGAIGWTRTRREQLGRTVTSQQVTELYELIEFWVYFDIDGDGYDEDLIVAYDRTSQQILKLDWNTYDTRPFEVARYQLRAHLFCGLGVMDMIRPYQEEVSDIHNFRNLNMFLANARFWKAKEGSVPDGMRIWPGKVQQLQNPDDVKPEVMADVYPSAPAAEAITVSLAERRIGINDLSTPRPSAVLGSRTPGITALSMLQQTNRRFTPAFDAIRIATAGAVRQCLFRYAERLLAGDRDVERHIRRVIGDEDGQLVIDLLRDPEFDESVVVELTASSASINKDADRQNAVMLATTVLAQYYQRTLELVAIAANPQTPPPVRDVARKIATAASELIDRTIRTFDQIRDPETFIVHIEQQLDQIQDLSQQGLVGLQNMLGSAALSMGQSQGQPHPALPNGGPPGGEMA